MASRKDEWVHMSQAAGKLGLGTKGSERGCHFLRLWAVLEGPWLLYPPPGPQGWGRNAGSRGPAQGISNAGSVNHCRR